MAPNLLTLMIANGVIAVILRYSSELGSFGDQLCQVVENKPKLCATEV